MTMNLAMAAILLAGAVPFVRAENIAPGVDYFVDHGYHIVVVDLTSPDARIRVSAPRGNVGNRLTIAAHAQSEGALVAINANFAGGGPQHPYDYPCGLARSGGAGFDDAYAEAGNCDTSMGWSGASGETFGSGGHEKDGEFMKQYPDIITGGGLLLSGGRQHDWNHAKLAAGRECTAAGLSSDRKKFVMVVTDNGYCTGGELQAELFRYGAADAVQLDGGGSSKLWIRGRGYVNKNGQDRPLPVAVLVFGKDGGDGTSRALCPSGNGLYCGGNGIAGDASTLYRCSAGSLTEAKRCPEGCETMPAGVSDRCKGSGSGGGACPYGNGLYCGGNGIPGDAEVLYRCTNGAIAEVKRCAGGCRRNPPRTADACR